MAYIFNDLDGDEIELYDSMTIEEIIDVTSGKVVGYRVNGELYNYRISKETYEAIKKLKGNNK